MSVRLKSYVQSSELSKLTNIGLKNDNVISPLRINSNNCWSKIEAQQNFLSTPPACFTILGKPGIGAKRLGDLLSEHWKCVHLNPDDIIKEQIALQSETGKCIEFNLKCGIAITTDVVLRLIARAITTDVVQHRGYVLTGIPIIETYTSDDCCYRLFSESSLSIVNSILFDFIQNLCIPEKILIHQDEEETEMDPVDDEEEEEKADEVPVAEINYSTKFSGIVEYDAERVCCKKISLQDQMEIISKFTMSPDVIIKITCPDEDVVTLRKQMFITYPSGKQIFLPIDEDEAFAVLKNVSHNYDYHCVRLFNTESFVNAQCHAYNSLLSVLDRYLLLHDPQYVITLDGRMPLHDNFETIKTKLTCLPLPRVLIPVTLVNSLGPEEADIINLSSKECLEAIEEKMKIAPFYKYSESLLREKCPVFLSKGKCELGLPKFGALFFDHAFLFSSQDALQTFCRNPRHFLKLRYLSPTCRIAILGTRKTGRSTLARCLSWIFHGRIIDFQKIKHRLISEKESLIVRSQYEEARILLNDKKERELEKREEERLASLEKWKMEQVEFLEQFREMDEDEIRELLPAPKTTSLREFSLTESEIVKEQDSTYTTELSLTTPIVSISGKPEQSQGVLSSLHESVKSETIPRSLKSISSSKSMSSSRKSSRSSRIRSRKSSKKILDRGEPQKESLPSINTTTTLENFMTTVLKVILEQLMFLEFCESAINDPDILGEFAPIDLSTPGQLEIPREDELLKLAKYLAAERNLYDTVVIEDLELAKLLIEKMQKIEDKNLNSQKPYAKWIIDNMPAELIYWETLAEHSLLPDDVFYLREDPGISVDDFLHYKSRRRDPRQPSKIFDRMEDPLLKFHTESFTLLPSKSSVLSAISQMVTALLETDYFDDSAFRDAPPEMSPEEIKRIVTSELNSFLDEINQYNDKIVLLHVFLQEHNIETIDIMIPLMWSPSELLSESLRRLRYQYGVYCKPYTPTQESEETDSENENKDVYRRVFLGSTGPHCPVTIHKSCVLRKGREEFVQTYKQKVYAFSSEAAKEKFSLDPEYYVNFDEPIRFTPPWRICIVGSIGSGCSTIAKRLADKMGLMYIDFPNFAFNCILQNPEDNCRNLYKWLDEPGISQLSQNLEEIPEEEQQDIDLLRAYFFENLPLSPELFNAITAKLWFSEPFCKNGIILDGFPRNESDLDFIREYFTFPDLIIELNCSSIEMKKRIFKSNVKKWKQQQKARQNLYKIEKENIMRKWYSDRETLENVFLIYVELLLQTFSVINFEEMKLTMINEVIEEDYPEMEIDDKLQRPSAESLVSNILSSIIGRVGTRSSVSSLSLNMPIIPIPEEDRVFITEQLDAQYPLPEFEEEWEGIESARERIRILLEEWYTSDITSIEGLKTAVETESIPWFSIETSINIDRIMNTIIKFIKGMKCRNESFFEQTKVIDMNLAELLLSNGFYFVSKFGVSCPVRVYEEESTLQMFLHDKFNDNVFPVIHRSYIYYCSGRENCEKFCSNPLIYITSSKINIIIHTPIKMAIIGPPKCGKTTLACRFVEEFGFSIVSRGNSLRNVQKKFGWTHLAKEIHKSLSRGETLSGDLLVQSLLLPCSDTTSLTLGYILDGFPSRCCESDFLVKYGLYPYLIIDLNCDIDVCLEYLNYTPSQFSDRLPRYSEPFLSHMVEKYLSTGDFFRIDLRNDFQNAETVFASWSKWRCWWESKRLFIFYMRRVVQYLVNYPHTAIPLGTLCITIEEFKNRCDSLLDYCPTCLKNGKLTPSEVPFNRTGLVRWRNFIYWFCRQHLQDFLVKPYYFELSLPQHLPTRYRVRHNTVFYENGRCIVTFSDNFPNRCIVEGKRDLAISYRNSVYIFANEECLNKFCSEPEKYYDKRIHYEAKEPLPSFEVSDLPVLGYLEQCFSNLIIKSAIETGKFRPKYPGLSPSVSAAIFIGLYLKINNKNSPADVIELYSKLKTEFEEKCKLTKDCFHVMENMDNPFTKRCRCCRVLKTPSSPSVFSNITRSGTGMTPCASFKILPEDGLGSEDL